LFLGITQANLISIGQPLLELRLLLITTVLVGRTPAQLVLQQLLPGTRQLPYLHQILQVLAETGVLL
jgi:hypothetical protein